MELALGTEPTRKYYAFELYAAAKKLVEEVMLTKPGENVVISVDTKSDMRLVVPTAQAAYAIGAVPTVVWYEATLQSAMEPPPPVAAALAKADVWIEYASNYALYSQAQREAEDAGARYACMAAMDTDALVRAVGKVDYPRLLKLGDKLVELTQAAKEVRMTDPNGMDLRAGQVVGKVNQDGGLGDQPGARVMLGGQVGWMPVEDSINGKIVFDGMVYPPAEIGKVTTPVTLEIESGRIANISGGGEAKTLESWLRAFDDPNMFRLAHLSYAFNPGVPKITGRVVEDERVFGTTTIGFGARPDRPASSHFDGVTVRPSVYLDGKAIEIEGKYVHHELVEICREMSVPGY